MYQTGRTIKETLDQIQRNELVLPAIQREFVWGANQVCRLFDSLMQGYPFGAFLYWQIEPENSGKFKYYDFIQCRNGLANLQLLEGQSNLEKGSKMPSEWLSAKYKGEPTGRKDYEDRHLLGKVPNSITDFDSFYGARRERLKTRIKQMLARQDSSS